MPTLDLKQTAQLEFLRRKISLGEKTQIELAKATGVDQSQVSRILGGQARRASRNVLKLCKYAESLADSAEMPADVASRISATLAKLTGHSQAEDAAIEALISSLAEWRRSWGRRQ
jgi:transcriptional regulator with XRE-family HTH domain